MWTCYLMLILIVLAMIAICLKKKFLMHMFYVELSYEFSLSFVHSQVTLMACFKANVFIRTIKCHLILS